MTPDKCRADSILEKTTEDITGMAKLLTGGKK